MSEHARISLKIVAAPLDGRSIVTAPPVLNASDHTIDFLCGTCGAVLMHAEDGQVHNVTICCTQCGSYNSTDE